LLIELKINGELSLVTQLAVLAPRPPYQTSAGAVALVASRPNGKGPVLTLELISTRAAEAAVGR
jgi:hypothetical protein